MVTDLGSHIELSIGNVVVVRDPGGKHCVVSVGEGVFYDVLTLISSSIRLQVLDKSELQGVIFIDFLGGCLNPIELLDRAVMDLQLDNLVLSRILCRVGIFRTDKFGSYLDVVKTFISHSWRHCEDPCGLMEHDPRRKCRVTPIVVFDGSCILDIVVASILHVLTEGKPDLLILVGVLSRD